MLESDRSIILSSFKTSITWRANMLFSIVTGPLFVLANYAIWTGVFEATGTQTIGGFTFEQMIVYIVISYISGYLLWDDVEAQLREDIRKGTLMTYLLRPVNYMRYQFMWKIGHRFMAMLIEYIPAILLLSALFGMNLVFTSTFLWYIAALGIAFVISFLLRAILGMVAFYLVRPRGVMEIYRMMSAMLYGMFLPLSLYPMVAQKVFFALPFQFVSYVPARMFMGGYELAGMALSPAQILLYGVVQCIVLYAIVALLWRTSIKRFTGAGV